MADDPAPLGPIPFWKSRILQSLTIAAITHLLAHAHLADRFAPADIAELANYLLEAIGYVALGMAAHQRVTLPLPPVTLRKPKEPAPDDPPHS